MRWLLAILFLLLLGGGTAQAQSCNVTSTDVDFGSVQLLTGASVDVTGTLTIVCSNIGFQTAVACPNIDTGTGGTSGTSRLLTGPSGSTLLFNLYSDAARTNRWGSRSVAGLGSVIEVPIQGNGSASATFTRTIYGRLFSPQATASTGSYSSSFNSQGVRFDYDDAAGCSGERPFPNRTYSFTVKAQLNPYCEVAVQNLEFGNRGLLTAAVDASTTMSVNCTKDTAYSVSLSGGVSGNTAARTMVRLGRSIGYQLYQWAAVRPGPARGRTGRAPAQPGRTRSTAGFRLRRHRPPEPTPTPSWRP